jgi:hypothetical protein
MQAMPPGGGLSEAYSVQGLGVSIKLAMNDSKPGPISQFKFTWASGKINNDLSNINGNPFAAEGIIITPSMENDPNNPTCVPIVCPAGASVCSAAYNVPADTRTMVCSDQSSILMITSLLRSMLPPPHSCANAQIVRPIVWVMGSSSKALWLSPSSK